MNPIICPEGCKIYVFCPGGYATGGPEALHQLAQQLNKMGFEAYMYYYSTPEGQDKVHQNYVKYQVPVVDRPENNRKHLMIMPESFLYPIFNKKFSKIRKAIWWLSVDYYFIELNKHIERVKNKKFYSIKNAMGLVRIASFDQLKRMDIVHIGHSYNSMVMLRENGIEPIGQISDYMNDAFFDEIKSSKKEDIIIYNPKKNDEFLSGIMSQTADLVWKPLVDMTPAEVAGWMARAKLYIDFGFHPGKERMPREACVMHCCMIIGKSGTAAYAEDMPIPEKYRFEKNNEQVPAIIACIKDCLANYDKCIEDFKPYRDVVYGEKEKFVEDIGKVFAKTSK
jgi:hypothetical protein